MTRQCLFCPNPVDSAEHIGSDWILEDLKQSVDIKITIGKSGSIWIDSPEVLIKCVCKTCNNGWMSELENANKFPIHAMINNEPCGLTKRDQNKLARWAVMKAMVLDSCNPARRPFYVEAERENLKSSSIVPARTLVWIGQFSAKGFHFGGTDIWGEIEKIAKASHGCVTSMDIGHLVMQVLSVHVISQFAQQNVNIGCRMGDWRNSLLDIFPVTDSLRWPPNVTFT